MAPAYSTAEEEREGYRTVVLRAGDGATEAAFAPDAGMLGCSFVHERDELLELGGGIDRYVREGKTIGIPLLHPWANRLSGFSYPSPAGAVELDRNSPLLGRDPNGLPIHGLLNGSPHWEVRGVGESGDSAWLRARLDFGARADLLAAFPFPHVIAIEARLADATLTITTSVTATGDVAVPISFGYHPYLRLPGVDRELWEVDLPVRQRLVLDELMIPTGATEPVEFARELLGQRTFDDGYTDLVPGRPFVLAGGGRELAVDFGDGYPFAQVYTPAGAQFICFEPMTAPTNALVRGNDLPLTQPGETFEAKFAISVAA